MPRSSRRPRAARSSWCRPATRTATSSQGAIDALETVDATDRRDRADDGADARPRRVLLVRPGLRVRLQAGRLEGPRPPASAARSAVPGAPPPTPTSASAGESRRIAGPVPPASAAPPPRSDRRLLALSPASPQPAGCPPRAAAAARCRPRLVAADSDALDARLRRSDDGARARTIAGGEGPGDRRGRASSRSSWSRWRCFAFQRANPELAAGDGRPRAVVLARRADADPDRRPRLRAARRRRATPSASSRSARRRCGGRRPAPAEAPRRSSSARATAERPGRMSPRTTSGSRQVASLDAFSARDAEMVAGVGARL